jgi:hypothetical protein
LIAPVAGSYGRDQAAAIVARPSAPASALRSGHPVEVM